MESMCIYIYIHAYMHTHTHDIYDDFLSSTAPQCDCYL